MTVGEKIESFFKEENIKYYSCLPIDMCAVSCERKLPPSTESVCFFLIPYNVKDTEKGNISRYAVPRDYHLYIKELKERFGAKYPEEREIYFFADNSPFSERVCAEKAQLGKVGKNGLLINSEYGSYVFIAGLCVPTSVSISHTDKNYNSQLCKNCEKCQNFCPAAKIPDGTCLSELTQRKKLTPEQEEIVAKYPVRWGCDICQNVCPCNKDAKDTPIEYFKTERISVLTEETLSSMPEEEFSKRAYSWRGRVVIERNIKL